MMKRIAQTALLAALVGTAALGLVWTAYALDWTKTQVDSTGHVGEYTSIAATADGDLVVSYFDGPNSDLKFAICDLPATRCDAPGDWTKVTVDGSGVQVGRFSSIAVNANGDPVISYLADTGVDLKFAICDLSVTGCDAPGDWTKYAVDDGGDLGAYTSIAVDGNGDPVISYYDSTNGHLKFARCDMSATNCDAQGDWTIKHWVDTGAFTGVDATSIAVNGNGDPVISYEDGTNVDLKFAICDMSATNCDATADWTIKYAVDDAGNMGIGSSIEALGASRLMISYQGASQLKFAICNLPATGCDAAGDWTKYTVDPAGTANYTSIAVDGNGDPVVSYYLSGTLKFATCDLSATGCDAPGDWTKETVDAVGNVGEWTSIALDLSGDPVISYHDNTNGDLMVVRANAFPPAATYNYTVECAATDVDVGDQHPGSFLATGTAMVGCTDPYWNESGKECADCTLESLDCQGTLQGVPVGIEVLQRVYPTPTPSPSSFTVCEQSPECGITGDLSLEVSADEGGPWCSCYDGTRWGSTGCVGTCTEVGGQWVLTCENGLKLCPCGTGIVEVSVDGPGSYSFVPVGGIAEWPGTTAGSHESAPSSSGSGFNHTTLGAALAAVVAVAVLAAGAWLARRRWAR
jgi:hypothetical protein